MSPPGPPQYDSPAFWDRRYKESSQVFEWYQDYGTLRRLLRTLMPLEADILQIGVGTSNLQADMAADGYASILSTDISQVAIDILAQRDRSKPGLRYLCADCRSMPEVPSGSFDFVLDKGTLDALMCGSQAPRDVGNTLQEVYRVLRPGGSFVCMTYGSPGNRAPHLSTAACPFSLRVCVVGKPPEAAPGGRQEDCRLMGPFHFADPVQREKLLALDTADDGLHWVYLCEKPPAPPEQPA